MLSQFNKVRTVDAESARVRAAQRARGLGNLLVRAQDELNGIINPYGDEHIESYIRSIRNHIDRASSEARHILNALRS